MQPPQIMFYYNFILIKYNKYLGYNNYTLCYMYLVKLDIL